MTPLLDSAAPDSPAFVTLDRAVLEHTWHAVARAGDVGDAPVAVELLGVALVLARLGGEVVAFDDVCAHRGAALSLGRVTGGCIECPYHGWQYSPDGACAVIPSLRDGGHIPAAAHLSARRCVERGGLAWVSLAEPQADVPTFPEAGPGWRVIVGEPYDWACDPTRRIENFLDFAHFAFVHDGVLGSRDRPEVPDHDVEVDLDGMAMFVHQVRHEPPSDVKPSGTAPPSGRGHDADEPFPTVVDYHVHLPLAAVLDQSMPNGERFVLGIASTPLGGGRSRTFWVLARDYDLDGDDQPYLTFQQRINEQDRPVIESLRPEFVPLDVTAELHVRGVDQVAIAYRRALLDLSRRAAANSTSTRGADPCSSAR